MTALIYCPFPDRESAGRIGTQLLDEKLIACINIGGGITAIFDWQGCRDTGDEVPALLKTDGRLLDRAVARLEEIHPYDAPAILGWHCVAAGAATREWLGGLPQ